MLNETRVAALCKRMKEAGVGGFFIGPSEDAVYLAGLRLYPDERTKGLMLDAEGRCFALVPQMYLPEIQKNLGARARCEVWADHEGFVGAFRAGCEALGLRGATIAFNRGVLAVDLIEMKRAFDFTDANGDGLLIPLRSVKDESELAAIERASRFNDEVMEALTAFIAPGVREGEIKRRILDLFEEKGAEGPSFPPIVATGANGAISHYGGDDGVVCAGDFVKVDIGCVCNGYCSDSARTFCVGEPTDEQRRLYEIVRTAQQAGEDAIRPGATGRDADRAARRVIEDAGYGAYFTHRLGHGVGLAVHEEPCLIESNDAPLAPGNVFSVEPSITIGGKFGIQIENLVVVGEDGFGRALNAFTKELVVVPVDAA